MLIHTIASVKEFEVKDLRLEGTGSRLPSAGARLNWRGLLFERESMYDPEGDRHGCWLR